jgi:hypothetical protein
MPDSRTAAAPCDLRPSTEMAWWDRLDNYDDRCHNDAVDAGCMPAPSRDTDSEVSVAIFGDSHALQWLPALVAAGVEEGGRVVALTKAACPPAAEFGRRRSARRPRARPGAGEALAWLADDPVRRPSWPAPA